MNGDGRPNQDDSGYAPSITNGRPTWQQQLRKLELEKQARIRSHRRWMISFLVLALFAVVMGFVQDNIWFLTATFWASCAFIKYRLIQVWRK